MPVDRPVELDLVAQRILKLAEIATLEHLEMLLGSQAHRILELLEAEEIRGAA